MERVLEPVAVAVAVVIGLLGAALTAALAPPARAVRLPPLHSRGPD